MKTFWRWGINCIVVTATIFLCPNRSQAIQVQDASYLYAGSDTWICSSTATLILAAGLTQGTTGLLLNNPNGSNVNLVLLETNIGITASPAANAVFELAWSSSPLTSTTVGNLTSAAVGISTISVANAGNITNRKAFSGNCWVAGTFNQAPTFFRPLGGVSGASSISPFFIQDKSYPPGSVVVPPGSTISLQASAAISELASFTVKQVPL